MSSIKRILPGRAMATLALSLLLLPLACNEPAGAPEPAGPAHPVEAASVAVDHDHMPLLLIGADALDLEVLMPLVEQGRVPTLARLLREGAHGVLLSEREMRSPALWTTIATGRPRSVHRIYDFVTGSRFWPKKMRGTKRRLVTSRMRKVDALWNMASDGDRRVAVVGWLNTWPAEAVRGVTVAPYVALGEKKQVTIKGAIYRDEARQVYPPERWGEINAFIVPPDRVPEDLLRSFVAPLDDDLQKDYPILERYHRALRWSLANTLTMRDITAHLLAEDRPDLTMVYFEGSDSLAHRFWLFREPEARIERQLADAGLPTDRAAELAERYGGVLDRYYELLDEVVAKLIDALPDSARVMIVSDHGFSSWTGRYPINPKVPFTGEHRLEGTIIVAGPDVRENRTMVPATQYDVAPTILDLLGVEVDVPFEGRSLVGRLLEDPGAEPEDDSDSGEDPDQVPFFEEEVERLRSLGYVE